MKDFSFKTRLQNIERMKSEEFDVLIIGGGITGAGVARDASMRGLKVALVEANDFAFGTSSRSSKLIHGGIRYLENLEFHLVFEALSERSKLFEIAPHLVHPLRFMIPLFENSRVGPFKMGLGMMLYDALALFQVPEMHEKLGKAQTLSRMPILRGGDLVGSCVYSDAYMDDDRLVHETMRSANEAGACIANFVKVTGSRFKDSRIQALKVQDLRGGSPFEIRCRHVVSTTGPWTDLVGHKIVDDWKNILRPTKGVHLTFRKDRLNLSSAVVMGAQKSSRIVFAIPRHEMIIVGTTDTDYSGDPSDAKATYEDVKYLLEITNEYFPGARLTEDDILSSYVGVRPLVKDNSGNEGKTSREHVILTDERGLTFVAGGKYTTYRLMSEQIVDKVLSFWPIEGRMSFRKCETILPLNPYVSPDKISLLDFSGREDVEQRLAERYGAEYSEIMSKFAKETGYWQLEAMQAIHTTMCLNLTDFYTRRVPLMLSQSDHGMSLLPEISAVFKRELGWSDQELLQQQTFLKEHIKKELSWKDGFSSAGK